MGRDARLSGDGSRTARRVVVSGEVQGVFFRDTCRTRAREAGLDGWVRNRSDGSVEAWFEGEAGAVGRLVDWCRHGPPHAEVSGIDLFAEVPTGERGFRIR